MITRIPPRLIQWDGDWMKIYRRSHQDLLDDEIISYTSGPQVVSADDVIEAGNVDYIVAASDATDHDVTTAGGVKLYLADIEDKQSSAFYNADNALVRFIRWRGRILAGDSYTFAGYPSTAVDENGVSRNYRTGSFLNASSENAPDGYPNETTSGATTHLDEGTNLFPLTSDVFVFYDSLDTNTSISEITFVDGSALPDAETVIRAGTELIYYTGKSSNNTITGVVRGFNPKGQTVGTDVIESPVANSDLVTVHAGGSSYVVNALSSAITDSQNTIPVVNSANFANTGFVRIGPELIEYAGKSANTLTGAVRGDDAVAHESGAAVVQGDTAFIVGIGSRLRGYEANAQAAITSDVGRYALVGAIQTTTVSPGVGVTGIARMAFSGSQNAWAGYYEVTRSDVAIGGGAWAIEASAVNFNASPTTQKVNPYSDGYGGQNKVFMANAGADERNAYDIDVFYHARGIYMPDPSSPSYDGKELGARAMAMIVSPDKGLRKTPSDANTSPATAKTLMLGSHHAITGSHPTADSNDPKINQEFYYDYLTGAWVMNRVNAPGASPQLLNLQNAGTTELSLQKRTNGGVSWNGGGVSLSFSSRSALLTYLASHDAKHANGDIVSDGTVEYVYSSGATAISDMENWLPSGPTQPWHFFSDVYPTDVTTGLNAFLAYCNSASTSPFWGTKSQAFAYSGNLANFHGRRHLGRARLVHSSGTFYVGDAWTSDVENTIYVSASGATTNDGLTPSTPLTIVEGYNHFEELVAQNKDAVWTFKMQAGTWGDVASRRLENFPTTKNEVLFEGEVDGSGEPTTIFNGGTQNLFRKLNGNTAINVRFKDLKFTNMSSTNGAVYIAYGGSVSYENLWAREVEAASILSIRYANGEVKNCDLWNTSAGGIECTSGIVVQDFYGDVNGNKIDGIVNSGQTGHAVQPSRGGISYVQNNELGLRDANDYHIDVSRLKRNRVRGNTLGPANVSAYRGQQLTLWNDDNTDYDDISGMGLAITDSFAQLLPGAYYSRVHNGISRVGHLFSNSTLSVPANTSRHFAKSLNGEWIPFKTPAWWLFSPNARGWFEFEVYFPETETVLFELNGDASGTGQRLAAANVSVTAGNRAIISMEFTGPIIGGTAGRYNSFIRLPSSATTQFGGTGGLSNPAMASASMSDLECRLYITRSSGTTGTVDLLHFRSDINI